MWMEMRAIWNAMWDFGRYHAALVISSIALMVSITGAAINLYDRRPRLQVRERRGDWCVLQQGTDIMFAGVIEAYNLSNRATAIQDYFFWEQTANGEWHVMESEYYQEPETQGGQPTGVEHVSNRTPLTIAPYSGAELRLRAFTSLSQPRELRVRVEVEDIFGKRHRVEVIATP
jgi:hypothetical protein